MKAIRAGVFFLCVAAAAGCASMSMPRVVSPEFWEQPESKVAVVLAKLPERGEGYRENSQGLLEALFSAAIEPQEVRCARTLPPDRFRNIRDIFQKEMENAGFHATVCADELDLEELPKVRHEGGFYERDLSEVFQQTGADRIVLLQLLGFGTVRTYLFGPIGASDPEGCALVRGVMVEKSEGRILWDTGETEGVIREPVIGPWFQEPNFPSLAGAVERALEKSKKFLLERFFEERLSPRALDMIDMHAGETPEQRKMGEMIARYITDMGTTSALSKSCSKPYRLTQNCSWWSGPVLPISLNGVKAMVAGSEDGKIVELQAPDLFNGRYTYDVNVAFGAVATLFEEREIKIRKVVGATMPKGNVTAYYLILDQDGYSLLKEYAVPKK
jgi:hypothetical protein